MYGSKASKSNRSIDVCQQLACMIRHIHPFLLKDDQGREAKMERKSLFCRPRIFSPTIRASLLQKLLARCWSMLSWPSKRAGMSSGSATGFLKLLTADGCNLQLLLASSFSSFSSYFKHFPIFSSLSRPSDELRLQDLQIAYIYANPNALGSKDNLWALELRCRRKLNTDFVLGCHTER